MARGKMKRVLFLGSVGSAKSSTASKVVGKNAFKGPFKSSGGADPCTKQAQKEMGEVTLASGEEQSREVIDTKGIPDPQDSPEQQRENIDELLDKFVKNPEEPIDVIIWTVKTGTRFEEHHKVNCMAIGSLLKDGNVKSFLILMTMQDMSESDVEKRLVTSGAKSEKEYREQRRDEWIECIARECPGSFSDEALKILRGNIRFVSNFASAGSGKPGAEDWEEFDKAIQEAPGINHEDAAKHESRLPHEELKRKEEELKRKEKEAAENAKEKDDAQEKADRAEWKASKFKTDFPKEFSNQHDSENRMEKANWLNVDGAVRGDGTILVTIRAERNAVVGANRWECIVLLIRQDESAITALHLNPGTAGGKGDLSTDSVQQRTLEFKISEEDALEMKLPKDGGVEFYYDKREGPGGAAKFTQMLNDFGEVKEAVVKNVS